MSDDEETPMVQAARGYRADRDRREASRSAPSNVVPFDAGCPPPLPDEAYANEFREPPDPPRKSVFYSAASLHGKDVPPREWLVRDLIPGKTVTMLSGDGGTGKSMVALQLACAVATEARWLGRGVAHGRVLFISAEDDEDELHRRLDSIVQAEGGSFEALEDLTLRSLAGEDALLAMTDPGGRVLTPSALYAEIERFIEQDRPALVVLDTLADLFPGNENDRTQVRQFIGLLRGLAIRHDCAVVLLAHPSLSGMNSGSGMSGSTGWNNSVRSRLYLERVKQGDDEPDPDARVLRTMKANYGPVGGEIALTWRNGVFVADEPETGLDRGARRSKAMRKFLELLRLLTEQGRHVNGTSGTNYAPSVFANHPDSEGITKEAFRDAMEVLFTQGTIRNATIRHGRKDVTAIQEVE